MTSLRANPPRPREIRGTETVIDGASGAPPEQESATALGYGNKARPSGLLARLVGLHHLVGGRLDFEKLDGIAPQKGGVAQHGTAGLFIEEDAVVHVVGEHEA